MAHLSAMFPDNAPESPWIKNPGNKTRGFKTSSESESTNFLSKLSEKNCERFKNISDSIKNSSKAEQISGT